MSEVENTKPTVKKTGWIRWSAIIPFSVFAAAFYLYFVMFFDLHMKRAIEWVGFKAVGAEVNVSDFKSSFIKGNVQISKIELTDADRPEFNAVELGSVRFDLNWDALLRLKFVVEELAVEGIQFSSKRSRPGKVAPPAPPSNEPSFAEKLAGKAADKLEKENQNNILGDTAQFLKTGKFDDQIQDLRSQLNSKKLFDELNVKWKSKQSEWGDNLKKLPNTAELNALKDRFSKIKYSDFKTPDELAASVKETDSLLKDIDSRNKQLTELRSQLDTDLKSIDADYKAIDAQVKKDIDTIKSRFKIPKIDAASFAKELFMSYLTPYMAKLDKYKAMAQKYLPPKYAKMVAGEKSKKEVDESIQPIPRAEGVTYEFPIKGGYPLLWIQKVKISSVSNAQVDYGDIKGLISDITTNQSQIGRPTKLKIDGEFRKLKINDISMDGVFDNTGADSVVKYKFAIGSYPVENLKLLDVKEGRIAVPTTTAAFESTGSIEGLKSFDLKLVNTFQDAHFDVSAADTTLQEVLKSTFAAINKFDVQVAAKGELKDLDLDIRSSLGGDLEASFNKLLQDKIRDANEKVQQAVNKEIEGLKAQLNTQVESIKGQAQNEIKKVQEQIEEQKKQAELKIAQAKKEFEDKANKAKKDAEEQANKAKKQAEDQAKSKLEQEAKKQADELKKKFKF